MALLPFDGQCLEDIVCIISFIEASIFELADLAFHVPYYFLTALD